MEYQAVIFGLISIILGWLMFAIRKAEKKMEDTLTKQEIKEKIDDKLEALRVELNAQKEDITEIKEMVKTLCSRP